MPFKLTGMNLFNYIIWSANPEIFPFFESIHIRWYGLLFAMGFIVGQQLMYYIYRSEGQSEKQVDILVMFVLIATILGARLGHVFFYEPMDYLQEPWRILYVWEGGLASHGAAFGIILGIFLYSNYNINLMPNHFVWKKQKREGLDFFWVIDRVVIMVALGGCFIRLGNFINSEIIGKSTESTYGVVFGWDLREAVEEMPMVESVGFEKPSNQGIDENGYVPVEMHIEFPRSITEIQIKSTVQNDIRNALLYGRYIKQHFYLSPEKQLDYRIEQSDDSTPVAIVQIKGISRHPTQLYESASSFLIFLGLFLIWNFKREKLPRGLLFGLFLVILFGLRFVHELFKENQVAFEDSMKYNMGQLLSIPLIIAGILILLNLKRLQPRNKTDQ